MHSHSYFTFFIRVDACVYGCIFTSACTRVRLLDRLSRFHYFALFPRIHFFQSLRLQVTDQTDKAVIVTKTIYEDGKFAMTASERGGLHELCIERTQPDLLTAFEANGTSRYEDLIVRDSLLLPCH